MDAQKQISKAEVAIKPREEMDRKARVIFVSHFSRVIEDAY